MASPKRSGFDALPLELQIYIWELAFYHNTTYNSSRYREAVEDLPIKSLKDINGSWLFSTHSDFQVQAERNTAFWNYGYPPILNPRATLFSSNKDHIHPHIRLSKPSFVPNRISVMSGIPDLLQVCRTSRWVTLRTWKSVLLSFRGFGPQPWRIMVEQIEKQLQKMGLEDEKAEEDPRNKVVERIESSWYGQIVLVRWCLLPGQEGTWLGSIRI